MSKVVEYVNGILFISLMMITTIDVIGRYVLNIPLMGSTELTEICLGLLIFSALPMLCINKEHITVDLFEKKFSENFKQKREIIIQILIVIGLIIMGMGVYRLAERTAQDGIVTEILHIPVNYFYYTIVGLIIVSIIVVFRLIKKQISLSIQQHQ